MNIYIDDTLSEHPVNKSDFLKTIRELDVKITSTLTAAEKGKLLSKSGVFYRIYGDLSRSEICLNESMKLLKNEKDGIEYKTTELRLAQTYQKQNKTKESLIILEKLERECIKNAKLEKLTDFVFQHKAKVYFDISEYDKAMQYFEKALKIRLEKGDTKLIESTEFAIEITIERMDNL